MAGVKFIQKRDGKTARFDPNKVRGAIRKAAASVHVGDLETATENIYLGVMQSLQKFNGNIPKIKDIETQILDVARNLGYSPIADAYKSYSEKRSEVRKIFGVVKEGDSNPTDSALMIKSTSTDQLRRWDRSMIVNQLEDEAGLDHKLAKDVAKATENIVFDLYERGVRNLTTLQLREMVDIALSMESLDTQRRKQAILGIPTRNLENLLYSKNQENSNIAINNSEALREAIADVILKQWALQTVYSPEVAEAHAKGIIHIHDLGYPERVYCSAHSLEYIKKFGLNKALPNLESKSNSPNSAEVLNQHVQTFLASKQCDYAGALGFGFVNIIYSSLLNRPVNVVEGEFNGKKMAPIEKKDLEKLVEQGIFSKNEGDDNYFKTIKERKILMDIGQDKYDQAAQNLIFAASQNAFSRGGQTLFIDFNIHTGVPSYMKNVPAIGPRGKYMVQLEDGTVEMVNDVPRFNNPENPDDKRNGDAEDSKLEGKLSGGKILTYEFFEPAAQKFAKALLKVWKNGDKDRRPFHFPKCDLHTENSSLSDPKQAEIIDYACEVASENGSIYFMFDRGSDAVIAQCCRLKEKLDDQTMVKYPELMRFTGAQNITTNLALAAYKGKTLEGTLKEIDYALNLSLQAHLQKKQHLQKLLDTDGSPLRGAGKPCDDGNPYINLEKATYIFGLIGLNEAVQVLAGKQLHESEQAYKTGLKIISHMHKRVSEMKKETGLKCSIEESPAESTTRKLAKVDWNNDEYCEIARKVIKGTEKNPYYTNSIHFAPDADVGLIDRIEGQSRFHQMITSGAIIHAYVGEHRPDKETIKGIVKKTLDDTFCSQICFSPTYTECDECGNVMAGEKELCANGVCSNSKKETLNQDTISAVTRVVGYNSRIKHWNGSQQQIYEDRKRAEEFYAGGKGRDMNWLYNPNGHDKLTIMQFGKEGCPTCENVKDNVAKILERMGLNSGQVDFQFHYLDRKGLDSLSQAAMYDVSLENVPTIVVAGKNDYWKKTTRYASKGSTGICDTSGKEKNDLIRPGEIREAIEKRLPEYGLTAGQ